MKTKWYRRNNGIEVAAIMEITEQPDMLQIRDVLLRMHNDMNQMREEIARVKEYDYQSKVRENKDTFNVILGLFQHEKKMSVKKGVFFSEYSSFGSYLTTNMVLLRKNERFKSQTSWWPKNCT